MSSHSAESRVAWIVEDDEHIGQLLKFIVEGEGFTAALLTDGRAAQGRIRGATAPPAIILLDIMLPFVDGHQLVREIRARTDWSCPIIMLTSKSDERDIMRALDSGANDYLVKPFLPEELRARIRRLVKRPA